MARCAVRSRGGEKLGYDFSIGYAPEDKDLFSVTHRTCRILFTEIRIHASRLVRPEPVIRK